MCTGPDSAFGWEEALPEPIRIKNLVAAHISRRPMPEATLATSTESAGFGAVHNINLLIELIYGQLRRASEHASQPHKQADKPTHSIRQKR